MVTKCCRGEGNRPLGRPGYGWENSNGMNHKILWLESVTVCVYIYIYIYMYLRVGSSGSVQ